jgi:hypothetical protein
MLWHRLRWILAGDKCRRRIPAPNLHPAPVQVYTRVFERIDALEELAEASNV